MTVGELKKLIDKLNDNAKIEICTKPFDEDGLEVDDIVDFITSANDNGTVFYLYTESAFEECKKW